MSALRLVLVAALLGSAAAVAGMSARSEDASLANPIRRVVKLLQKMQEQVAAEGDKEEELYKKFMCYCTTGKDQLEASISAAEEKIPKVTSALEEARSSKAQQEADVKKAKADRAEGEEAIATATELRKKEATAFAKLKGELETNISAIAAAVKAIEKGMAGSFLQTQAGATLRKLAVNMEMSDVDRDMLTEFLQQGDGYAPKSGQIAGILKEIGDTMSQELGDATSAEEKAIKDYEALVRAKTEQIQALTKEIEEKLESVGELGVEIVNMEEDIDDTAKALAEDKKFFAELDKGCETKTADWEERQKTRTADILAIHETIGILNNDDALELFKKTLPAPSLLQTMESSREVQTSALSLLKGSKDSRVALIALTLRGGAKSFEKVIAMIDEMIALLGEEQKQDDAKKAYCLKELDTAEDEKKMLEQKIVDLEKAIDTAKEGIETLADEIAELLKGIKDLDGQVKEATATREEQNAFYKKTMQEDTAAKEILKMAKNRLAKFYAPKLYKPPARIEQSAEGRIYNSEMGIAAPTESPTSAGIARAGMAMAQADPGPPPATWSAYKSKGEEHGGVVAMLDLLLKDLDKEMTSLTTQEKDDQAEYEAFVTEAASKRSADSRSAEQKAGEKAELEALLLKTEQDHKATNKELYLKEMQLKDLHMDCDWLLSNFDVRVQARAGEVDSLKKAKAVLSGADYSLVQAGEVRGLLRGARA